MDGDLLEAVDDRDIGSVRELLRSGADINEKDEYDATPLINAAMSGLTDIVRLLIEHKALLDEKDDDGYTALMYAARYGDTEIVRLLVDNGAAINKRNSYGETALSFADQRGHTEIQRILKEAAQKTEHVKKEEIRHATVAVKQARVKTNAIKIEFKADGKSPLHRANLVKEKPAPAAVTITDTSSNKNTPKKEEASVSPPLKIGDKVPDGSVYAGISPDSGDKMFVMPENVLDHRGGNLGMTFYAAAKYAEELNDKKALGHGDWRVPTKDELNVLYKIKEKGALKDTFNLNGGLIKGTKNGATWYGNWYWSSTIKPTPQFSTDSRCWQDFSDGMQRSNDDSNHAAVRYVRTQPDANKKVR